MSEVSNLLDSKGHEVLTVKPGQTVKDALMRMDRIGAGTCVVMDGGKVVGIMSEKDIVKSVVMKDQKPTETTVAECMTKVQYTVAPDTTLDECMKIMTEKRTRHLPVLRGSQLFGIVSIGDVVKYLLLEKDFQIRNLKMQIKK
ncbi:MAG: CBS domain-containing protein [Pontiella sp.]